MCVKTNVLSQSLGCYRGKSEMLHVMYIIYIFSYLYRIGSSSVYYYFLRSTFIVYLLPLLQAKGDAVVFPPDISQIQKAIFCGNFSVLVMSFLVLYQTTAV